MLCAGACAEKIAGMGPNWKSSEIGWIQRFSLGGGAHGVCMEREPITGVWGWSPQRGPRVEPLVGGQEG